MDALFVYSGAEFAWGAACILWADTVKCQRKKSWFGVAVRTALHRCFPKIKLDELESYETGKTELIEENVWQNRVAGDFSFDPETYYPETMQVLDLGVAEPEWRLRTADDLRREDQKGHQSLRERYAKE